MIIYSLVFMFTTIPVLAASDSTGTTAANYLKISGGVRAAGMGDAFIAVSDDSSAIYWNPAGLVQNDAIELCSAYTKWFQDISLTNISASKHLWDSDYAGMSLTLLNMGEIEETTLANPDGSGRSFSPSDMIAVTSYARKLSPVFSIGINVKYISDTIDKSNVTGYAFDLGTLYSTPFKDLNMGLSIRNIGGLSGVDSPLPVNIGLGLAYKLLNRKNLLLACDVNFPNDDQMSIHIGCEYNIVEWFALRIGCNTRKDDGSGGNLGVGLGLIWNGLAVDYAYAPYGDLGEAHRVSFGIRM